MCSNQTITLPLKVKTLFYVDFTYKEIAHGNRDYMLSAVLNGLTSTDFSVSFVSAQDGGSNTNVQPYYFALGII